jgi:hypothetical protein
MAQATPCGHVGHAGHVAQATPCGHVGHAGPTQPAEQIITDDKNKSPTLYVPL